MVASFPPPSPGSRVTARHRHSPGEGGSAYAEPMDELDRACDAVQDEIIKLRTQLRWAQSSEELWSRRFAEQGRDRDRLSYALADAQALAERWESVARSMRQEADDLRADNLKLRRLLAPFVEHRGTACRFDEHGLCQVHTDARTFHGACAVAVGRAFLHGE